MDITATPRVFAAIASCVLASTSSVAQSPAWSPGLAAPGFANGTPTHAAFGDFGAGPRLYIAVDRTNTAPAIVYAWDGQLLEAAFEAPVAGSQISALTFGDDGNGAALFASVEHGASFGTTTSSVWRIDGSAAANIGDALAAASFPFTITALEFVDVGSGPVLHVCGAVDSIAGIAANHVARWDGANWSAVGPVFPANPGSIAAFDDGSGPVLHVGVWPTFGTAALYALVGGAWQPRDPAVQGQITSLHGWNFGAGPVLVAGGWISQGSNASGLAVWNGSNWSLASQSTIVNDVVGADLGAGPKLYVGAQLTATLGTFDGSSLHILAPTPNSHVNALASGFLPAGQRLAAVGSFSRIGSLRAANIGIHDGTSWSPLGNGFEGPVRALTIADIGAGPALLAAGTLFTSGTSTPQRIAVRSAPGFTPLPGPNGAGVQVLDLLGADLGGGTRLFAAGTFVTIGGAMNSAGLGVWNGTSWSSVGGSLHGEGHVLCAHDDGAGTRLFAGGNFDQLAGGPGQRIAAWNGTSWDSLAGGMDDQVNALAIHDDGAGAQLVAGGMFESAGGISARRIARWNGSSWSALGSGMDDGSVLALASFDDGTGVQLYAGGTFTGIGGVPISHLARWNGASWSDVPGGGANGAILTLHVHDDGRGPALYVGGAFSVAGGVTAYNLARFDGSTWEAVDGGFDDAVRDMASIDDDGDGALDLFVGGDFRNSARVSSGYIARLPGQLRHQSFCFGDGTFTDHTTPCPCGNDGAPGHGCGHSFDAGGAQLGASGAPLRDDLVLASSDEPATSFTLFLQHSAAGDTAFHDGVLCASGALVRLRGRAAVAGQASFPNSVFAQDATTTLSQRGGVTVGSGAQRFYSAWYRNASTTFCPPATANVTNGLVVTW